MSDLQFVFVHGLSGWGSYDKAYKRMPYWGMRGGDLMTYLCDQEFACYAASVAPSGSAWDRACELYAQLAGTRTDYGKAHSLLMHHDRYGKDFTGRPLLAEWKEETRLVLLGHSFGGATVRLFSALMADGSAEERAVTEAADLSPRFAGGMASRIHTIVTLAAPMNGTTAYDLFQDPSFDPDSIKVPRWSKAMAAMMARGTKPAADQRDPRDYAAFDMHIDNAMAMNDRIPTLPDTYYYSVPCRATERRADGTCVPRRGMEPLFVMRSTQIGAYTGTTAGGHVIDDAWRDNDGLVNTISASVPSGAPSRPLDGSDIRPGIWNVLPVIEADHMFLQGGLMRRHEICLFYLELLKLIRATEKKLPQEFF
ncbi:MAG: hypothetical protein IKE06_01540 [Solobacterium sp.]|nr:hypothetical protein [Solobacterium sp.]